MIQTCFYLVTILAAIHGSMAFTTMHRTVFMTIEPSSSVTKLNSRSNNLNDVSSASSRRRFLVNSGAAMLASAAAFMPKSAFAFAAAAVEPKVGGSIQYGDASIIMSPKEHGTSHQPVQSDLLYGVSNKLADQITNFNRRFAEPSWYYTGTNLEDVVRTAAGPVTFYDSVTGKPLFVAPLHRSVKDFLTESKLHGWPSFRDDEVVWDNVRVLSGGETVSVDGTHLGHNLPDGKGNRYCINLVSIAGSPVKNNS